MQLISDCAPSAELGPVEPMVLFAQWATWDGSGGPKPRMPTVPSRGLANVNVIDAKGSIALESLVSRRVLMSTRVSHSGRPGRRKYSIPSAR